VENACKRIPFLQNGQMNTDGNESVYGLRKLAEESILFFLPES
jgi:hypothetical protein